MSVSPIPLPLYSASRRSCFIRVRGKFENQDRIRALAHAVLLRATAHAQVWNLSAIDGITLAQDLSGNVERLGRRLTHRVPISPTLRRVERRTVTAGCVVEVSRRQTTRWHVVLDVAYLNDLLEGDGIEGVGANIVAHELAHIAFLRERKTPDWATLLDLTDWRCLALRELALPLWDEYAACRAGARFGDRFSVTAGFMNCLAASLSCGLPRLPRSRRRHWHTTHAALPFIHALTEVRRPLLSAAYLMGHLDGLGVKASVMSLSTPARNSALAPCWESFGRALRQTWEFCGEAARPCDMDALCAILILAARICGGDQPPVNDADVSRCVDALLDALIELEVVEELMRIEGTFALDAEDLRHLRLTSGRS
jgi:hypothetical protein